MRLMWTLYITGYLIGEYKATGCYNPDGPKDSRHTGGAGYPSGPTRGRSLLVQPSTPTSLSYKFRSLSGISVHFDLQCFVINLKLKPFLHNFFFVVRPFLWMQNAFQFAFFAWTWASFFWLYHCLFCWQLVSLTKFNSWLSSPSLCSMNSGWSLAFTSIQKI